MNEAKQYNTMEEYHERDDGRYKQRIQDRLREVNVILLLHTRHKSKSALLNECVNKRKNSILVKSKEKGKKRDSSKS